MPQKASAPRWVHRSTLHRRQERQLQLLLLISESGFVCDGHSTNLVFDRCMTWGVQKGGSYGVFQRTCSNTDKVILFRVLQSD